MKKIGKESRKKEMGIQKTKEKQKKKKKSKENMRWTFEEGKSLPGRLEKRKKIKNIRENCKRYQRKKTRIQKTRGKQKMGNTDAMKMEESEKFSGREKKKEKKLNKMWKKL